MLTVIFQPLAIFMLNSHSKHLPANDCFAHFLAEEVKLDPEHEDFEDQIGNLRNRLIGHAYGNLYRNSSQSYDDKFLGQWSGRWRRGFMVPMQREDHILALLRYGLTDLGHDGSGAEDDEAAKDEDKSAFYSFCQQRWVLKSRMWHCRACGKCRSRRHWYCGKCKRCSHGLQLPCKGCGGVCEEYYSDDISDTDCQSEDGSDTRND